MTASTEQEKWLPRVEDLLRAAQRTGYACTDFLDPAQQAAVCRAARDLVDIRLVLSGGYPQAERQMAQFYAAGEADRPCPVIRLKIKWNARFDRTPQHREVLGAILGTGLTRNKIGDICLDEKGGTVFVSDSVAQYVCANCDRVGHIPVTIEIAASDDLLHAPQLRQKRDTVASLRLDAVVAAAANLSREAALRLIRAEKVKRNHLAAEKPDALVYEGDLLSIAGKGRFRILAVSETKKGRYAIVFEY